MDTINERIQAAKTADDIYIKLIHLHAAIDLIALKAAEVNGIIDNRYHHYARDVLKHDEFPTEFKDLFLTIQNKISWGLQYDGIINAFAPEEYKDFLMKGVTDVHENIEELIVEVEEFGSKIEED